MTNGTPIDPMFAKAVGDMVRDLAKPVRLSMEQAIPQEQIASLSDGMSKIADAINKQAEATEKQNELLATLTKAISELKITVPKDAIVVNIPQPIINIPEIKIPPIVFPERKKREITINHDDGTQSIVKEA